MRATSSVLALALVALQNVVLTAAFTGTCSPTFVKMQQKNTAMSMSAVVEAPTESSSSEAIVDKIR
jgi:hypothetical protein